MMRKRNMKWILALMVLAIGVACISKKRVTKEFVISSNPAGAHVLIDGQDVGVTPVKARMDFELNLDYADRGLIRHEVIVKMPGYKTSQRHVYHNDPLTVHFEMKKEEGKAPPPPPPTPREPRQP